MQILILRRSWYLSLLVGLLALTIYVASVQSAVLSFESDYANRHFVFDQMGPYQPNPYDSPDDGADRLAQYTSSAWVGLMSGDASAGSLFWDGGLDGGANSPLNLLLPDSFDLVGFIIAGVYGTQTVTLQGLNNGQLLFSENLGIDLTPQFFQAGWMGIDQLRIVSGADFVVHPEHVSAGVRTHWAIDDLVYNVPATAMPLPDTALMLIVGGLLLHISGWRMSPARISVKQPAGQRR